MMIRSSEKGLQRVFSPFQDQHLQPCFSLVLLSLDLNITASYCHVIILWRCFPCFNLRRLVSSLSHGEDDTTGFLFSDTVVLIHKCKSGLKGAIVNLSSSWLVCLSTSLFLPEISQ